MRGHLLTYTTYRWVFRAIGLKAKSSNPARLANELKIGTHARLTSSYLGQNPLQSRQTYLGLGWAGLNSQPYLNHISIA